LKEVTITGGTTVDHYAFYDCESLTSIEIPSSVTSIGSYAFGYCISLTSIIIPGNVTSIGNNAFYGCESLTSVTIGNSVTSIGDYAFCYCESLTSIEIPDSVTSIGDYAFCYCESLTSIEIPDSVTSIGENAFWYCESLTSIDIPDSVTSIGEYAFAGCDSLTSITIPDSVTNIGDYAFYYCESLTSITIPDSVTSIGEKAFCNCEGLTSVIIGNSVTSIGSYAFYYCSSLTSITIPGSVTSIGYYAFDVNTAYIYSQSIIDSITSESKLYDWFSDVSLIIIPGDITASESMKEWYNTTLKCSINGEEHIAYSDHIHNLVGDNCDSGIACDMCNLEIKEHCYSGDCDTNCDICGYKRTTEVHHHWDSGTVIKEATRQENGEIEYFCSSCHSYKISPIPKTSGCGGGSGVSAAFISCGGITALWFTFKRRIFKH